MGAMARRILPVLGGTDTDHGTKGLIRLTMACNERCPFCNVPVEDYPQPTPSEEETARDLEAFLRSGERTLTISGGEPTLLKDRLVRLVREARARGVPFVELQTNAILIDARYAAELAAAGLTSAFVSLLSDVPELHDELAGLTGAFPLCLRGIDALVDAGVAVTLNPVVARQTQDRLSAFVRFVAERLPLVRAISVSAVQPHGRAARTHGLMPDYAVLGPEIARAHQEADRCGIVLLNPYCGVPLCVGWDGAAARSVEAIEAERAWRNSTGPSAFGLENRGDKRHGPPCRRCAWRTRCAGAWHAYWHEHAESGIAPPAIRLEPWCKGAADAPGQSVVWTGGRIDEASIAKVRAAGTPTVWLAVAELGPGDGERIAGSGCTDLAIIADAESLSRNDVWLDELRAMFRVHGPREDALSMRCALGIRALGSFRRAFEVLSCASAAGVDSAALLVRGDERHHRFVEAARRELRLELSLGGDDCYISRRDA
jgi:MoaA/NifB/PqqE/SkfB family radical SAM enzyme